MNVEKSLCRSAVFTARDSSEPGDPGDGLTLSGYAAVFGVPTRIDSWEGTFDETIRQGAFKKTLRENTPVMQFDHGRHPMIGSIPIGTYSSLSEDDQGLAVEGRLEDNWLIQPVRDAIASGAVSGMSFRFEVVRDVWTTGDGKAVSPTDDNFWDLLYMGDANESGALQRELVEVKMPEAGPVVFPAYAETSVGVRAVQLARSVMTDTGLTHAVRSALARPGRHNVNLPADPELRREVALSVLFGTAIKVRNEEVVAPPEAGHPADETITVDDLNPEVEDDVDESTEQDDAPADSHPSGEEDDQAAGRSSGENDAPADGHPSEPISDFARRMQRTRRDYVTRNRVGKRY
jgi:HK97 family phage prohead protease